ncbi:MAG: hypothetical protein ACI8Z1_002728 [Candidatus Azotimanducaceae bacterium]|jgi:hypothetical protein
MDRFVRTCGPALWQGRTCLGAARTCNGQGSPTCAARPARPDLRGPTCAARPARPDLRGPTCAAQPARPDQYTLVRGSRVSPVVY